MDTFDLKSYLAEGKLFEEIQDNSPEEKAFDAELMDAANGIASILGKELKKQDQLDEALITTAVTAILTGNALIGFISKYSAKLFKKLNWKKGEDIAEKIHHWAHDNEVAFQTPIKRVLAFFIKDEKKLDMLTKGIYAIIIATMAANYGVAALGKLAKADWFQGALSSLKTIAKADEAVATAYPVIKSLI